MGSDLKLQKEEVKINSLTTRVICFSFNRKWVKCTRGTVKCFFAMRSTDSFSLSPSLSLFFFFSIFLLSIRDTKELFSLSPCSLAFSIEIVRSFVSNVSFSSSEYKWPRELRETEGRSFSSYILSYKETFKYQAH